MRQYNYMFKYYSKWTCITALIVLGLLMPAIVEAQSAKLTLYYPVSEEDPALGITTHIYFTANEVIITDLSDNTFLYRQFGEDEWQRSVVDVKGPHSIAYQPEQGLYYVNDTENNRMIAFPSLDSPEIAVEKTTMAGVDLHRIHDVIYDEMTGWIYALNPYDPAVFRFKELDGEIEKLDFSDELEYTRAITVVDSTLYLIGSSRGKIIEIVDWDERQYKVYQSYDHKRQAPAGSWTHTGLIPNDAEFFNGKWYVSSYFTNQYVPEPTPDTDNLKLISFDTWDDFEAGNWEDLSEQLPTAFVPYFFTVHNDQLYLAGFFDASWEGGKHRGHVYLIEPVE